MNTFIRDLFATIGLVTVVVYCAMRLQLWLWDKEDKKDEYIYYSPKEWYEMNHREIEEWRREQFMKQWRSDDE